VSKLTYVCLRDSQSSPSVKRRLRSLSARLTPDNVPSLATRTIDSNGILISILNPVASIATHDRSVCLGHMFEHQDDWHVPLHAHPDGTYALFRGNDDYVEVLADTVASRTVWYYFDDAVFIASSSQRAIVFLLDRFEPDADVIPWVLSTGTLGPDHAWDRRLRRLEGDSSVTLHRPSWSLSTRTNDVTFSTATATDQEHETRLRQALQDTFATIKLDYSHWALLLSGGFDSRAILCLLNDTAGLRTLTWGLKSSLDEPLNDACVARDLAAAFNLRHDYFETDVSSEPVDKVISRFLVCGEGRVDHISGYMDGLTIWRTLFEHGIHGIIRGDEVFGLSGLPIPSPVATRQHLGLALWSDFSNLKSLEDFGLTEQAMPQALRQRAGESLETWRDRLYEEYRHPVVLAALSDVKLPYLEILNPLLSRRIVLEVRSQPDHARTDKSLYKSIVRSLSPDIPFAKYPAVQSATDILKSRPFVEFLRDELSSAYAGTVLPRAFIDYVLGQVTTLDTNQTQKPTRKELIATGVKARLPEWARRTIGSFRSKVRMDFNTLAFRLYVIVHMNRLLAHDAQDSRQGERQDA